MKSNHVLIATTPNDLHAAVVRIAMQNLGHRATIWLTGDMPENASAAWSLSNRDALAITGTHSKESVDLGGADVFWFRRTEQARIDGEMHAADRAMAISETTQMVRGLLRAASDSTYAVNHYSAAMSAEIKPRQLALAKRVGFSIPDTLISNTPAEIRAFIAAHEHGGAIYKPFSTAIWESKDRRVAFSYTAEVTLVDLPSDRVLRLSPGIFQEKLEKAFEIRVTCMGDEIYAVRLNSQATETGRVDWRSGSHLALRPEMVELPDGVSRRCRDLLQLLGLEFGCIDLVVKPDGEYVFLEINQMGQFLWIEDANPSIPLLDAFVRFLLRQGRSRGVSDPGSFGLSYHEFKEEAVKDIDVLMSARRGREQGAVVYAE